MGVPPLCVFSGGDDGTRRRHAQQRQARTAGECDAAGLVDSRRGAAHTAATMCFLLERAGDKSRLGSRPKGRPAMVMARAAGET